MYSILYYSICIQMSGNVRMNLKNKLLSLQSEFLKSEKDNSDKSSLSFKITELINCKDYIQANNIYGGLGYLNSKNTILGTIATILQSTYENPEENISAVSKNRSNLFELAFIGKKFCFELMSKNLSAKAKKDKDYQADLFYDTTNKCAIRVHLVETEYFEKIEKICKKNNIEICTKATRYLFCKKAIDSYEMRDEKYISLVNTFTTSLHSFTKSLLTLFSNHFQIIYNSKDSCILFCMEQFMDQQMQIKRALLENKRQIEIELEINKPLIIKPNLDINGRIVGGKYKCDFVKREIKQILPPLNL